MTIMNSRVIGALAAVGLAAGGNDGRIFYLGDWPEDLRGVQAVTAIRERNVCVRELKTGREILSGRVDLVKKLRPNVREHQAVLFVKPEPQTDFYTALKLP